MKKTVSLILALVMLVCTMLFTTSCGLDAIESLFKHPIDQFSEKLQEEKNFQMKATMYDLPIFGTVSVLYQFDDNIVYTPGVFGSGESYTKQVGDITYTYEKDDNGKWVRNAETTDEEEEDDLANGGFVDWLDSESYEKVEGEKNTYKQKDDVDFEDIEDVVLTLDDDSCTIEGVMIVDGVSSYEIKIVISKIGEMDLSVPDVD